MSRFQELFELCGRHILAQGKQALLDGDCKYYMEVDGEVLMCAAAPLLDIEQVKHAACNTGTIIGIFSYHSYVVKEEYKNLNDREIKFVRRLQNMHDNFDVREYKEESFNRYIKNSYKSLAPQFNLKTEWMNEFPD